MRSDLSFVPVWGPGCGADGPGPARQELTPEEAISAREQGATEQEEWAAGAANPDSVQGGGDQGRLPGGGDSLVLKTEGRYKGLSLALPSLSLVWLQMESLLL